VRIDACIPAIALAVAAGGCDRRVSVPPHAPPAVVTGARPESALATITLTPEAETRLGVEVSPLERRQVAQALAIGGEVVVPPGRSLTVTAPVAATVVGSVAPAPGALLRRGQLVLELVPLPSPSDIAAAEVRVGAARRKVQRAEQLLAGGSGTRRAIEEAQSELDLAQANARAGRPEAAAGGVTIRMTSPQAGILRDLRVGPGQTVASGAPLFQVDGATSLWVRAPVYAGDAWRVDRGAPARVDRLSERRKGAAAVEAAVVAAPPSANADAASVDLFYQLPVASLPEPANAPPFRPGQKVGVTLLLRDPRDSLVVPSSAILYDVLGGTWVYVRTASHTYSRRRVEVDHAAGDLVVLARGPAPGEAVVKVGAAELFGTEFGNGK
jgi:cobalt-zinc-cadmium efflux system membrane fusion protein